jgi:hypothetical protein
MSYIVPSVLVYQQLSANAGVASTTPDLDTVIVGPCNNVVTFDTTSAATLATSVATLVGGVTPAVITDNSITLNAYPGSIKVGQLVDATSLGMYVHTAVVDTKYAKYLANPGTNTLTVPTGSVGATASTTSGQKTITMSTPSHGLYANDIVTFATSGPSGGVLRTRIVSIAGAVLTVNDAASATVAADVTTRVGIYNLNPATSTLNIEVGDIVEVTGTAGAFLTTVLKVNATGVNANEILSIQTADLFPSTNVNGTSYVLTFRKNFANLPIPAMYNSNVNYTTGNLTTSGYVTINPLVQLSYGVLKTGEIHAQYTALRQDLNNQVLEISNLEDQIGTLGHASELNPLALGVELALANTTGRIFAIAVQSNDLAGFTAAMDASENVRLYAVVPLTQDIATLEMIQQRVDGLSTPQLASWRVAIVNTAIPTSQPVGVYSSDLVNSNAGNTLTSSSGVLLCPTGANNNSNFVGDGVIPGDILVVTAATGTPTISVATNFTITGIVSNQSLIVSGLGGNYTSVTWYIQRTLSKTQQAAIVAANSTTFGDHRVVHVQPDIVGVNVNGTVKYLPGYYLCAANAGLFAGLPAQKGLTNIGVAGVSDLKHSNFYFTRAQLDSMAAAGTFLVVQQAQGTIPYVRHSLTTDMTVLQYREVQQVKTIDFISYYFHDILQGFPGRYNITPDTLQTLRTTIIAGAKYLQGQTLPKIGAPLTDFQLTTVAQNATNLDMVDVQFRAFIPTVMNYVNFYLTV